MLKKCNKCDEWKELSQYQADKRNKDGKQGICSVCKNEDKQKLRSLRVEHQSYKLVSNKCCNKCKQDKKSSDFFKDAAMIDGFSTICKDCKKQSVYEWRSANKEKYNADQRAYQKAHPEMRYGSEIKRRYGCTLEQYNQMLSAQGGACMICKRFHNPAEKRGRLYVDHCHTSGKVRALICSACNSMIGYAKDDTRVLAEAIAYIVRHKQS